jgi:N-acetylglucosamine kinase-like BadF-type ATPase
MKADLLLGVDGGGTRTRAAVADLEGRVLARGFGPCSNLQSLGLEEVGKALTTAIEGALLQVPGGLWKGEGPAWRSGRLAAACFGLAGVDSREDEARISSWVKEQAVSPRFSVLNDSELVLACGTPEGWGVALIAGTGSICLGRAKDGRTVRVGGWGPLVGDEGSGHDLAVRALHLATKTADGRAHAPTLLRAALSHYGKPDAQALVHHLHEPSTLPSDIAGLATSILDLAGRGDPDATALMSDTLRELADHVQVVIRSLRLTKPPLAISGGMLRSQIRTLLLEALADQIGPVSHVTDPVLGAVTLAQRLKGEPAPRTTAP